MISQKFVEERIAIKLKRIEAEELLEEREDMAERTKRKEEKIIILKGICPKCGGDLKDHFIMNAFEGKASIAHYKCTECGKKFEINSDDHPRYY